MALLNNKERNFFEKIKAKVLTIKNYKEKEGHFRFANTCPLPIH